MKTIMKAAEQQHDILPEESFEPIEEIIPATKEDKKGETKQKLDQLVSNEEEGKVEISFYTIVGGELVAYLLRKQAKFIALLTLMTVLYVTNRYAFQEELVVNKKLSEQLEDRRLRAVVATSNLVEYTRRSNVQEELPDTTLHQTHIPHRYIKIKTSTP